MGKKDERNQLGGLLVRQSRIGGRGNVRGHCLLGHCQDSRKSNPWDNAACESFMKTLKDEEVLRNEYRNLADARASIREFREKIYNEKRLHSALGYMPPARFERNQKDAAARQLSV